MVTISHTELINALFKALYQVARRRSSQLYADEIIKSSFSSLCEQYSFLNAVLLPSSGATDEDLQIHVSPDINKVSKEDLARALSSFLRMVYTDMNAEVGLYFITEIKEYAGKNKVQYMKQIGMDLDQIQIEQHHLYIRREKLKAQQTQKEGGEEAKQPNLLGYTWGNIGKWKHEPGSPFCVLYDKQGNVLDRINLDHVIQYYVDKLSGVSEGTPSSDKQEVEIIEKDYVLLELMKTQDMDAKSAAHQLQVTEEELNEMIRKLTRVELIHFTSHDTVELTEKAINYLAERGKTHGKE